MGITSQYTDMLVFCKVRLMYLTHGIEAAGLPPGVVLNDELFFEVSVDLLTCRQGKHFAFQFLAVKGESIRHRHRIQPLCGKFEVLIVAAICIDVDHVALTQESRGDVALAAVEYEVAVPHYLARRGAG